MACVPSVSIWIFKVKCFSVLLAQVGAICSNTYLILQSVDCPAEKNSSTAWSSTFPLIRELVFRYGQLCKAHAGGVEESPESDLSANHVIILQDFYKQ